MNNSTPKTLKFQLNIVCLVVLSWVEMTVISRLGSFYESNSWLIIGLDTDEAPKHPTNRKYNISEKWGHNVNHS